MKVEEFLKKRTGQKDNLVITRNEAISALEDYSNIKCQSLLKELIGMIESEQHKCHNSPVYGIHYHGLKRAVKLLTSKLNEDGK